MTTARRLSTNTANIEEKAIAYLRVSTQEQKKKGLSIPYQKSMAIKYVEQYNNNVDKNNEISKSLKLPTISREIEFIEESKSASSGLDGNEDIYNALERRPELKRIVDLAQQKRFKHLIVLSHDRLIRNFEQFISLKYILDRHGIIIHYSRPGESFGIGDSFIGKFLDNILASVAELEASVLGMRVRSGCKTCVISGHWPGGRAPLGYKIEKSDEYKNKRKSALLKKDEDTKLDVEKIYQLYSWGYGYRKIAEKMNQDKEVSKWKKSNIEKILKNETYTGYITWNRRSKFNNKEGITKSDAFSDDIMIIDENTWGTIKELRDKKAENNDPYYYNSKFKLKGKLYCSICQKPLATRNYGKRSDGKEYLVYRCNSNSTKNSHFSFSAEKIENDIIDHLINKIEYADSDMLWHSYSEQQDEHYRELLRLQKKLETDIKSTKKLKKNLVEIMNGINQEIKDKKVKEDNVKSITTRIVVKDKLNVHAFQLDDTLEKLEMEKERVDKYLKSYSPDTREKFIVKLKHINEQILSDKVDDTRKRMYIDELIDRVLLSKTDLGEVEIKIIIKPSYKL